MPAAEIIPSQRQAIEHVARAGYAARGVVFVVIGYFALRAAYATGQTMSSKEAITQIFAAQYGSLLLAVLVFALFAFASWRFVQAIWDVDAHGTGTKGLGVRAGLLASATSYVFLGIFAGSLLIGLSQAAGGGTGNATVWTAIFSPLFGPWITFAIGLIMLVVAGAHIVKGVKAGFLKYMTLPRDHALWLKPFCQFGLIARGITFLVIAFLLFTGASLHSPGDTPGLDEALDKIASWPFGWILLSITGCGLIAFGSYSLLQARYRQIRPPNF